jgi:hypothetical protein
VTFPCLAWIYSCVHLGTEYLRSASTPQWYSTVVEPLGASSHSRWGHWTHFLLVCSSPVCIQGPGVNIPPPHKSNIFEYQGTEKNAAFKTIEIEKLLTPGPHSKPRLLCECVGCPPEKELESLLMLVLEHLQKFTSTSTVQTCKG